MWSELELKLLERAQQQAEQGNRAMVRWHVDEEPIEDVDERMVELFESLELVDHADQAGVLLYVAVAARQSRVMAGHTVDEAVEPDFWVHLASEMARGFRTGEPSSGLIAAMGELGELLRTVLPAE